MLSFCEAGHGVEVFEIDGNATRNLRHAAIAGRTDNLRDAGAARDGPGQGMLAASGTEDEDFHCHWTFRSGWGEPERLWSATEAGEVNQETAGEIAFPYTEAGCAGRVPAHGIVAGEA